MVYATGGLAYGDVSMRTAYTDIGTGPFFPGGVNVIPYAGSRSSMQVGYVAGGGIEYAITDRLSAKVEGFYGDLGRSSVTAVYTGTGSTEPTDIYTVRESNRFGLVRAGLNYRFTGLRAGQLATRRVSALRRHARYHHAPAPFGLVNGKRRYYADVLYYDANRCCPDVGDADYWSGFIGSYVGGGWLLKLVTGLGGASLTVVGAVLTTAIQTFTFFLVSALLFGLVGMLVYAFLGYTLYLTVMLALPYLLGGIAAYVILCLLLAFVKGARQRRAG